MEKTALVCHALEDRGLPQDLKSGCRAEQARPRTAERLVRLSAVFCILRWRVFWLTMFNRTAPDIETALVLTEIEIKLLDRLIPEPGPPTPRTYPAI